MRCATCGRCSRANRVNGRHSGSAGQPRKPQPEHLLYQLRRRLHRWETEVEPATHVPPICLNACSAARRTLAFRSFSVSRSPGTASFAARSIMPKGARRALAHLRRGVAQELDEVRDRWLRLWAQLPQDEESVIVVPI